MNEQVKRYIERTKIPNKQYYSLSLIEVADLAKGPDKVRIVCDVFNYGLAKGYRAALQQIRLKKRHQNNTKTASSAETGYFKAALHKKIDRIDALKSLRLINILVDKLIEKGPPEN